MAFAIILSMSIPAMAVTEEIPEGYRLQRGLIVNNSISYEAIESMDSVMVRELIGGGPIEAYVVESFYIDENADGIQLADTSASFSIGYSVQRIYEKGSGYDNFKIMAGCYYLADKYIGETDVFAMAWSDDFTLYDDYAFETRETYEGSGHYVDVFDSEVSYINPYDYNAEIGFSYSIDLGAKSTVPSAFYIVGKIYKHDSTGTANVTMKYAHSVKECNVDVTFSIPAGISFTPSVSDGVVQAVPKYASFEY